MNNTEIYPVFSNPICVNVLENISNNQLLDIKNIIENIDYKNSTNYELPNENKFSKISLDLNLLNHKKLSFLKKILMQEFNNFKNDILKYHNNDFKMTTSWVSKTEPTKESEWHQHNNCMYSGIFYVDTKENSGDISFQTNENKRFQLIPTEFNIYNSTSFTFTPVNGMVIFFESQLYHKIFKNNSNITRYSIAFNLMPVGNLGIADSFCNLKI